MFIDSVHLYSELNGSWWHLELDYAIKKKNLTWYWKWRSRRDHLTCCLTSHLFCQDVVPGTLRWDDKVAAGGADHSLRWLYASLTKSATHKNIIFIEIMKAMMMMYYNIAWQNLREKNIKCTKRRTEFFYFFIYFISLKFKSLVHIMRAGASFYFGGGECRAWPNGRKGKTINNSRDAQAQPIAVRLCISRLLSWLAVELCRESASKQWWRRTLLDVEFDVVHETLECRFYFEKNKI